MSESFGFKDGDIKLVSKKGELIDVTSQIIEGMNDYINKRRRKPPKVDERKYKGRKFINIRSDTYGVETIDEFDTMKEARKMLKEYRAVYRKHGTPVWISQRPDNTWYKDEDE